MSQDHVIGMMDGAYFVGRREILDWINQLLQLNLQKVEQTASGCVALQLLDSLHPGCVPMSKVDWTAKQDFQYIANYKLLQSGFDKLGVGKHVPVDQLIRAKYQDNLEFMQWFKRYHDIVGIAPDYDPVAARANGKGAPGDCGGSPGAIAVPAARPKPLAPARRNTAAAPPRAAAAAPGAASTKRSTSAGRASAGSAPPGMASASATAAAAVAVLSNSAAAPAVVDAAASERLAELEKEVTALIAQSETVKRERDFYFEKLREVETLLQMRETNGLPVDGCDDVFKILYATEDAMVAVGANGEVLEGEAARAYKEEASNAELQLEEGDA